VEVDARGLLSPDAPGAAIWPAIESERHEIGPHILRDISVASDQGMPAFLSAAPYQTRSRYFARFRNALVVPRCGLVMPRPGEILADSAAAVRWGAPRLQGVPAILEKDEGPELDTVSASAAPVIEAPVVLLTHQAHPIYGHWLMDCLPGVLFLREHHALEGRLLLAPRLHPWQRESLARLGLDHGVLETGDDVVIARDVIFPSFLDVSEVALPSSAARRTFAALAGAAKARSSGRGCLYISRGGLPGNRTMLNEARLELALGGLGFDCVRPERLSLARQIELFANAAVVAGAHGSGLANIGFAPPGCIVLDLLLSSVPDPWICRLSAILGQRYAYLVTPVGPMTALDERGVKRADPGAGYEIEIEAVIRLASAARRLHNRYNS
jgi:capsular polysaccharide biosynthesis protein